MFTCSFGPLCVPSSHELPSKIRVQNQLSRNRLQDDNCEDLAQWYLAGKMFAPQKSRQQNLGNALKSRDGALRCKLSCTFSAIWSAIRFIKGSIYLPQGPRPEGF